MSRRGSSFYWAMRLLGAERRRAMFALYDFCHAMDDIADEGNADAGERLAQLQAWRQEVEALYAGAPSQALTQALAEPVRRFGLARADLLAVIDGMAMDARGEMRRPSEAALALYCDRVAVAVGRLSLKLFGIEAAEDLAEALGSALQLTNILRDLAEDGARGRLYLPDEVLAAHGITSDDPAVVLAHPALPAVCDVLATRAEEGFRTAHALMAARRCRRLRPAGLMAAVYQLQLHQLRDGNWRPQPRIGLLLRLSLAIRWFIHPTPWDRGA